MRKDHCPILYTDTKERKKTKTHFKATAELRINRGIITGKSLNNLPEPREASSPSLSFEVASAQ